MPAVQPYLPGDGKRVSDAAVITVDKERWQHHFSDGVCVELARMTNHANVTAVDGPEDAQAARTHLGSSWSVCVEGPSPDILRPYIEKIKVISDWLRTD